MGQWANQWGRFKVQALPLAPSWSMAGVGESSCGAGPEDILPLLQAPPHGPWSRGGRMQQLAPEQSMQLGQREDISARGQERAATYYPFRCR